MACIKTLKSKGYKLTSQRIAVLEVLHNLEGHTSPEDIFTMARSRQPNINRSTVYRTLDLLKSLGMVAETDFGEGRIMYHHIDKGHHHHLICTGCGTVIDIDEGSLKILKDRLLSEFRFAANMRHLAIPGLCQQCQAKSNLH